MRIAVRGTEILLAASLFFFSGGAAAGPNDAQPPETQSNPSLAPRFAVRELYAAGHFGNSYEVMGECEMRRCLEEAKHWGFNRYGDWFDMVNCTDPFRPSPFVTLGRATWERRKRNLRLARELGFECDFAITPNHVYVDQCLPELLATKKKRLLGQLICPSKPQARAIILKNYENLFSELADEGVRLDSISSFAYDWGGCACEECRPWILTWAKLVREIHAIAERHHPGVKNHLIGWWWSAEEHELLADWADREAPGWIESIYLYVRYGRTKPAKKVRLPKGCQPRAFLNIGYADVAKPADLYGHFGPVSAPARLSQTVDDLVDLGATGVMAYSEGQLDDVNKALIAGLGSGRFRTADDVLRAYARRYFAADDEQAAEWARWLAAWGRPFEVDPEQMARQFVQLNRTDAGGWRKRQWELKPELFRLNKIIGAGTEWTPGRLKAVDQFWRVQEQIHRGLWGLGLASHAFVRGQTLPPWYAGWAKYMRLQAGPISTEQ